MGMYCVVHGDIPEGQSFLEAREPSTDPPDTGRVLFSNRDYHVVGAEAERHCIVHRIPVRFHDFVNRKSGRVEEGRQTIGYSGSLENPNDEVFGCGYNLLTPNNPHLVSVTTMYSLRDPDNPTVFYNVGSQERHSETCLCVVPFEDGVNDRNTMFMELSRKHVSYPFMKKIADYQAKQNSLSTTPSPNINLAKAAFDLLRAKQTVEIYVFSFMSVIGAVSSVPPKLNTKRLKDIFGADVTNAGHKLRHMNLKVTSMLTKKGSPTTKEYSCIINFGEVLDVLSITVDKFLGMFRSGRVVEDISVKPEVGSNPYLNGTPFDVGSKDFVVSQFASHSVTDYGDSGALGMKNIERANAQGQSVCQFSIIAVKALRTVEEVQNEILMKYKIYTVSRLGVFEMVWGEGEEDRSSKGIFFHLSHIFSDKHINYTSDDWVLDVLLGSNAHARPCIYKFVSYFSAMILCSRPLLPFQDIIDMICEKIGNNFEVEFSEQGPTKNETGKYALHWYITWIVCVVAWTVDVVGDLPTKDYICIEDYDRERDWFKLPHAVFENCLRLPSKLRNMRPRYDIDFTPGDVIQILAACQLCASGQDDSMVVRQWVDIERDLKNKAQTDLVFEASQFIQAVSQHDVQGRRTEKIKSDQFSYTLPGCFSEKKTDVLKHHDRLFINEALRCPSYMAPRPGTDQAPDGALAGEPAPDGAGAAGA